MGFYSGNYNDDLPLNQYYIPPWILPAWIRAEVTRNRRFGGIIMKLVCATLFLVLIVASPAFSQLKQNDKHTGNAPDRTSVNGFGGRLIVVENPHQFVQEWLKPDIPKIKRWSATDVRRGDSLGAFILFIGCRTDAFERCYLAVDYTIYKPDGGIYAERKAQPLWQERTAPPPNIQLGRVIPAFHMGNDDPIGEYKVKTRVTDLNANVSIEMETRFRSK